MPQSGHKLPLCWMHGYWTAKRHSNLGLDPSPQRGALQRHIMALQPSHWQALLETESSRKQLPGSAASWQRASRACRCKRRRPLLGSYSISCCACCQICPNGTEHNLKLPVVLQRVYCKYPCQPPGRTRKALRACLPTCKHGHKHRHEYLPHVCVPRVAGK